jgi:hypothetical protein
VAARARGRPTKGEDAKTVPIAFRMTERQWEVLQKLLDRHNAALRADHKFAAPMTIPEFIRMMIMVEGENQGIVKSLLDEPSESFNVRPKRKR